MNQNQRNVEMGDKISPMQCAMWEFGLDKKIAWAFLAA
jgi:hypothetical protein